MDDAKQQSLENQNSLEEEKLDSPLNDNDAKAYDYAAQNLLQIPIEKTNLKNSVQNTLTRGGLRVRSKTKLPKSAKPKKSAPKNRQTAKLKTFLTGLLIAIFCFLISYGTLFYLNQQEYSFLRLSQTLKENIWLMLFIIAIVSCVMTILLVFLLYIIKFLNSWVTSGQLRQKNAIKKDKRPSALASQPSPANFSNNLATEKTEEQTTAQTKASPLQQGQPNAHLQTEVNIETAEEKIPKPLGAETLVKQYDDWNSWQFHFSLQFLLRRKLVYRLQSLAAIFVSLLSIVLAMSYVVDILPIALLFFALFLLAGIFFLIYLRNQYVTNQEHIFQSMLQQIYQYSSPTNSYNQLNAVNMLYALAFTEARYFQKRVIIEFQNILKLTRSSWYQTKYNNSPSILVEEVLRKLLSAVNFRQLLAYKQIIHIPMFFRCNLLREYLYHGLFLKSFQSFQAFRSQATVSLLSQMGEENQPRKENRRAKSPFVLENYYLVGMNLSNLRVKEAHFQNCQLSRSNWANSDLSDCNISSCRLEQAIFYRSSWRRFLWTANTACDLEFEHCLFLQGNLKYCNLGGIQSNNSWKLQHCLLQECDLNHSVLYIETWQSVKASSCKWNGALLYLEAEFYTVDTENLANILGNRLQIKA